MSITNVSKSSTISSPHHVRTYNNSVSIQVNFFIQQNADVAISEWLNSPLSPIEDQSGQIESSSITVPISVLSDIPSDNAEHSETIDELNLSLAPSVKSLGKRKARK